MRGFLLTDCPARKCLRILSQVQEVGLSLNRQLKVSDRQTDSCCSQPRVPGLVRSYHTQPILSGVCPFAQSASQATLLFCLTSCIADTNAPGVAWSRR
jgi:hypothetical protein